MQTSLTQAELDKIKLGKKDLEYTQEVTGVDWRILAGIWYRENSLKMTIPGRVGGVWQFDPPLSSTRKKALLDKYSTLSEKEKLEVIQKSDNFKEGSILAACFLRDKVKPVLDIRKRGILPDEEVGDALYAYNGKKYGANWRKSPYVNNNADDDHMGLVLRGTMPDVHNPFKRVRVAYPDRRLGAFVVYRELGKIFLKSEKTKKELNSNPQDKKIKKNTQKKTKEENQKTISLIDGKENLTE